jgi:hypothetical protein
MGRSQGYIEGVRERCLEGVNDIGLTWNRVQFLLLENSVATSRMNILYNGTKNNFVHFNHVLIPQNIPKLYSRKHTKRKQDHWHRFKKSTH